MGGVPSKKALLNAARGTTPYSPPFKDPLPNNPLVYLDIQMGRRRTAVWLGRIVIELRKDVVPRTVDYFLKLVTSHVAGFTLKGCCFHRIYPHTLCQTGALMEVEDVLDMAQEPMLLDLNDDFGALGHLNGVVSMDPSSSQFTFCGTAVPWLDGQHVVFGQVIGGYGIVEAIQMCGSPTGVPCIEAKIIDCGELDESAIYGGEVADAYSPRTQSAVYPPMTRRVQTGVMRAVLAIAVVASTTWLLRHPVQRSRVVGGFLKEALSTRIKPRLKVRAHLSFN